ncbi:MAG: hypothetical protein DRH90_07240 [Deltaproteobacteria bacterium]|nr:MAG: hypothetical protein DRH90_07240 [Deltaproteobacteria bacterium]
MKKLTMLSCLMFILFLSVSPAISHNISPVSIQPEETISAGLTGDTTDLFLAKGSGNGGSGGEGKGGSGSSDCDGTGPGDSDKEGLQNRDRNKNGNSYGPGDGTGLSPRDGTYGPGNGVSDDPETEESEIIIVPM